VAGCDAVHFELVMECCNDPINVSYEIILQGGTDITVPARSAEKLAAAMRDDGNHDETVRIIPGVSHSLLPDPVGAMSG
jgi:hypothetical protein